MKYCLIANPHARGGRCRKKLQELRGQLEKRGLQYDFNLCEGLDHARQLSREANQSEYDVIVAVGGDGTINRVLNGFFDSSGRRRSRARMGVVHIGTSPDFCRSYGIPTDVAQAVKTLAENVSRPVSVGRISFEQTDARDAAGGQSSACFGCCANIGLGASLARLANSGIRKYAGDFLGTFFSLLRVLATYRPQTLRLCLDDRVRVIEGVYSVSVGKTAHIASGIKVRHELREQDSRFYVLAVQNLSWIKLAPVLCALYSGRPIKDGECLTIDYARSVRVASATGVAEVEFDGDPGGGGPCRIEAAPDPLDLVTQRCL